MNTNLVKWGGRLISTIPMKLAESCKMNIYKCIDTSGRNQMSSTLSQYCRKIWQPARKHGKVSLVARSSNSKTLRCSGHWNLET